MTPDPEETTYTSADEWPTDDDGGQDMTLPSGAKVRIAAPPVMWLAATGKIPANLVAIGKRHEADKKDWTPAEQQTAVEWLVAESFIEPKVSATKKPGYLSLDRISDRDKEAVAMRLRLQDYANAMK